jgi:hypothetical protein
VTLANSMTQQPSSEVQKDDSPRPGGSASESPFLPRKAKGIEIPESDSGDDRSNELQRPHRPFAWLGDLSQCDRFQFTLTSVQGLAVKFPLHWIEPVRGAKLNTKRLYPDGVPRMPQNVLTRGIVDVSDFRDRVAQAGQRGSLFRQRTGKKPTNASRALFGRPGASQMIQVNG